MQIPMVKTLLTYRRIFEQKNVVCEYIEDDLLKAEKQSYLGFKLQEILNKHNPYNSEKKVFIESTYREGDGSYGINYYDEYGNKLYVVDVLISNVLEFDGKVFELKEVKEVER
ncbi:hypothetical protein ACU3L3_07255 [Priestia endophytica]